MKNKSEQSLGRVSAIDCLANAADTMANSRVYRNSHRIATVLLCLAAAAGIGKSLADQHDSAPNKPQQAVTIFEDE